MTPFVGGFAGELVEKRAFVGKALSAIAKRPLSALVIGGAGLTAGMAAHEGFKAGLGGDRPRYLQASRYGPSAAFYTNYHDALPHNLSSGEEARLSENFPRSSLRRR